VETYPEESRTFRENGSTEVLEKEEREVWKMSDKALIEKKKSESGPKLMLKDWFGTNSRPWRGQLFTGESLNGSPLGGLRRKTGIGAD
jgi:hypothetical protein